MSDVDGVLDLIDGVIDWVGDDGMRWRPPPNGIDDLAADPVVLPPLHVNMLHAYAARYGIDGYAARAALTRDQEDVGRVLSDAAEAVIEAFRPVVAGFNAWAARLCEVLSGLARGHAEQLADVETKLSRSRPAPPDPIWVDRPERSRRR